VFKGMKMDVYYMKCGLHMDKSLLFVLLLMVQLVSSNNSSDNSSNSSSSSIIVAVRNNKSGGNVMIELLIEMKSMSSIEQLKSGCCAVNGKVKSTSLWYCKFLMLALHFLFFCQIVVLLIFFKNNSTHSPAHLTAFSSNYIIAKNFKI
ncbi:hypothetical protein RFI_09515, partial [Reticulomyxa filosa]